MSFSDIDSWELSGSLHKSVKTTIQKIANQTTTKKLFAKFLEKACL